MTTASPTYNVVKIVNYYLQYVTMIYECLYMLWII